jgi:hypothetical protein
MGTSGQLRRQILGGDGYSTGWSSITAVDLDGDGQDEMFFYRKTDGAYRYYDVRSNGTLGKLLAGGFGYSTGWSSITAVDLNGDGRDEFFFYRATDGAYRYYSMNPNGTLNKLLQGGTGYSKGWSAITAVDLNGDRRDEFFFYRKTDGAYRYYSMNPNGTLKKLLQGGTGYSTGWSSITAVDLNGDRKDEFFFYRSTDGAYRYYSMNANGTLSKLLSGGTGYSKGWTSITAVNIDFNTPIIPPPPGPCDGNTVLPAAQCAALVSLYNATFGANWVDKTNWLKGNPCTWVGVICTGSNVTTIDLEANNLTGTLPDLTALTNLSVLDLSDNFIGGTIPASLGSLKNLTYLDIDNNQLTGAIPAQLGGATKLNTLSLEENQLTSVPGEIGNLELLQRLDLSDNPLSNNIPANFWTLANLTTLDLEATAFTMALPINIQNMPALTILNLADSGFDGPIPSTIGNLTALTSLDMSGMTNMAGTAIPEQITNLTNLTSLNLSRIGLTGAIPENIGNLSGLTLLDLSDNSLSGAIPASITSLINLSLGGGLDLTNQGGAPGCLTTDGVGNPIHTFVFERDPNPDICP